MGALANVLLHESNFLNNYSFAYSYNASCLLLPSFDKINIKTKKIDKYCNKEYFEEINKSLLNKKNSIIIIGGRLPLYLSGSFFNNNEGGIEGLDWTEKFFNKNNKDFKKTFQTNLKKLSKSNKVILIYPIPEVGYDVPTLLNLKLKKTKNNDLEEINLPINDYLTTSYNVYKQRVKESFDLLNSIEGRNIFRLYPHKIFCDTTIKDRCITHNNEYVFYEDNNHLSYRGNQLISEILLDLIKSIK